jgi:hypothetical protein
MTLIIWLLLAGVAVESVYITGQAVALVDIEHLLEQAVAVVQQNLL